MRIDTCLDDGVITRMRAERPLLAGALALALRPSTLDWPIIRQTIRATADRADRRRCPAPTGIFRR